MLVYGDHSERADPQERLAEISRHVDEIGRLDAGIDRHSALGGALIALGQVLQGVADADFEQAGCDRRTAATDALTGSLTSLAAALCCSWDSGFADIPAINAVPQLTRPGGVELKTPEGFAFYTVYPEAFIAAARQLALQAPPCVIGIRSIGTTLGSVVAAAIGAASPATVRPFGDPFARKVRFAPELERELLERERHFVIVDEGPGQSGSSFGAVADWLEDRGVPRSHIAVVPSHAGGPGPQASERHRSRWREFQRVPADLSDRLPELLQQWLVGLIGQVDDLIDISGGNWRRYVYAAERDWPAAMPAWERRKFLACAGGRQYLIKFAGLGAIGERKLRMARALDGAGLTPEPIGLVHGFLVERWCSASEPLRPGEKPIEEVAAYLGTRARLFPAAEADGATLAQLLAMAERNVGLALGREDAALLDRWRQRVEPLSRRVSRIRTDNKLDRHEWRRAADGRLLKTDALDHHAAHDLIGCQDLAWDVAGATVEFALDGQERDRLIAATERASGRSIDRELLDFCRAAYCSFRLGQATLAIEMSDQDAAERDRLERASRHYVAQLHHLLDCHPAATPQESLVG